MPSYRPTQTEDQPALRALLHEVWGNSQSAIAYYGAGQRPGILAEKQGQLIGYSHIWHSPLHPMFTYIGVHVHPDWRNQGIGTKLWQAVLQEQSGPLKAKTYASQWAGTQFLLSRGLQLLVETHESTLVTATVTAQQVTVWTAEAAALGFELCPMTALNDGDRAALADLHDQVYAQAHRHDPSVMGILDAEAFLGSDLRPEWLFVAKKGGQLVGVSSVRLDQPDPMLGWFGVIQAAASAGKVLTLALTGLAVQAAAQDGVSRIGAELDDADPLALAVLMTLPWQPGGVWQTFTSPLQ